MALSARGSTALVGAVAGNSSTGAVYVFTLRGGTWSQTAVLTAPRGAPDVVSGGSVALSALGTTALVGANERNSGTGAAAVFTLRSGIWSQTARLTAARGAPADQFGDSVALSARAPRPWSGRPSTTWLRGRRTCSRYGAAPGPRPPS